MARTIALHARVLRRTMIASATEDALAGASGGRLLRHDLDRQGQPGHSIPFA
jgi:hypothetical protein